MYIVIAGSGVVGGNLARTLADNRHDVVVVDRDEEVCEEMSALYDVVAINGAATNIKVLEEAGLRKADVAVAALATDADNLAFALLARTFKVPRIIARMDEHQYEEAYRLAGVSRTISVKDLFVGQLVLEIEQPTLQQVAVFAGGNACVVTTLVPDGAAVEGKSVTEVGQDKGFPQNCLIVGIYREATDEFVIPRGNVVLRPADRVFLAGGAKAVRQAAEFLQRQKQ